MQQVQLYSKYEETSSKNSVPPPSNSVKAASLQPLFLSPYQPTIEHAYTFQYITTIGDLSSDTQNNSDWAKQKHRIVLTLSDVGGHPSCSSLWDSCIDAADAFMLVFDVGDKKSFELLWPIYKKILERKQRPCLDIPMLLVGNMIDTVIFPSSDPTCPLPSSKRIRQVVKERGQELASILNIPYVETTSRAPFSVSHCFKYLIQSMQSKSATNDSFYMIPCQTPLQESDLCVLKDVSESHEAKGLKKLPSKFSLKDSFNRMRHFTTQESESSNEKTPNSLSSSAITTDMPITKRAEAIFSSMDAKANQIYLNEPPEDVSLGQRKKDSAISISCQRNLINSLDRHMHNLVGEPQIKQRRLQKKVSMERVQGDLQNLLDDISTNFLQHVSLERIEE
jgi:GTPase SAR1 family protein